MNLALAFNQRNVGFVLYVLILGIMRKFNNAANVKAYQNFAVTRTIEHTIYNLENTQELN